MRSRDGMAAFAAIVSLFGRVGKELLIEGQKDMVQYSYMRAAQRK